MGTDKKQMCTLYGAIWYILWQLTPNICDYLRVEAAKGRMAHINGWNNVWNSFHVVDTIPLTQFQSLL
jgi:hypothetical protein